MQIIQKLLKTIIKIKKNVPGIIVHYIPREVKHGNIFVSDNKPVDSIIKPPLRKRPGKKKFLSSVLTILSKSTAGTQYDLESDKVEKAKVKVKKGNKYKETIPENSTVNGVNYTTNRKKYKSKILTKSNETDQIVILRSKNDIVHTPSNYSDKSNIETKWTDFPRLVKPDYNEDIENKTEQTAIYHCVADGIGKMTAKRVSIDSVPKTLVSDKPKDKLYNFFVDLLETTLSVYDVNTEFTKPTSISSSNTALQIDESVAKKLEVRKDFEDYYEKPFKYVAKDEDKEILGDDDLIEHLHLKPLSVKLSDEIATKLKKKKFKTKLVKKQPMNTQSFYLPTKKTNRKHMKRNLLTLFKDQLRMDIQSFEEPNNLYQALKMLARNKRKKQKSIQFDQVTKYDDDRSIGCRLRRQKIYSTYKKSNKKLNKAENEFIQSIAPRVSIDSADNITKLDNASEYTKDLVESNHSLEVYNFDFDKSMSTSKSVKGKELLFAYHSSPSVSD